MLTFKGLLSNTLKTLPDVLMRAVRCSTGIRFA
jgi:hypothetical protein